MKFRPCDFRPDSGMIHAQTTEVVRNLFPIVVVFSLSYWSRPLFVSFLLTALFLRFPQKNHRNLHRSYAYIEIFLRMGNQLPPDLVAMYTRIYGVCVICDIRLKKFFPRARVYICDSESRPFPASSGGISLPDSKPIQENFAENSRFQSRKFLRKTASIHNASWK